MHVTGRRLQLFLGILAILIAILLGGYTLYKYWQHANTAEPAPPLQSTIGHERPLFVLSDITGRPHNINEWDNHVVIINFWATWCKPCRREIPMFTQLQAARGAEGLQFIGIAIDEKTAVDDFISKLEIPVNYPMLAGEDDAITIAKQFGNEFGVLPYSVIIDRNRRIAFIQFGEFPKNEIEQQIDALL